MKLPWVCDTLLQVCNHSETFLQPEHDGIEDDTDQLLVEGYAPFEERDFPGGYVPRYNLYKAAWKKCLDRIQVRVISLATRQWC
jgi:hypothetical protein